MPSTLIGIVSGSPQLIYSGTLPTLSGGVRSMIGSIQFKLSATASGSIYLGFSGNVTMNSGNVFLSGGGLNDGYVLGPGESLNVPKAVAVSGSLSVYAHHDAACSGQARLYWQHF